MGLRESAKRPVVMSLSGWSASMPTRKLLPKRYQAEQEQQQPHYAEEYADPGEGLGVEELLLTHRGQTERGGKHDVEVEESKWGDEEVLLVDLAEMHRPDPASSHQQDAGDNHSEQQHDGN